MIVIQSLEYGSMTSYSNVCKILHYYSFRILVPKSSHRNLVLKFQVLTRWTLPLTSECTDDVDACISIHSIGLLSKKIISIHFTRQIMMTLILRFVFIHFCNKCQILCQIAANWKRQGLKWTLWNVRDQNGWGRRGLFMYLTLSMIRRILLNLYLLPVFLRSSVNLQVYTDKLMESFEFGVISYFPVQVERGCFISGWK